MEFHELLLSIYKSTYYSKNIKERDLTRVFSFFHKENNYPIFHIIQNYIMSNYMILKIILQFIW